MLKSSPDAFGWLFLTFICDIYLDSERVNRKKLEYFLLLFASIKRMLMGDNTTNHTRPNSMGRLPRYIFLCYKNNKERKKWVRDRRERENERDFKLYKWI